MKKIVLPGLAAGLAMLAISLVLSMLWGKIFPGLQTEYANANLFRPWSDPLMSFMFVQPLVMGFLLAWVWNKVKSSLKTGSSLNKGLKFGLAYWVVTLPGLLMSYSCFPISGTMILSWMLSMFVQALIAGLIYGKMNPSR